MKKIVILTVLVLCSLTGAQAQFYGIKSNAAMMATGTLNLGAEVAIEKQWSIDISGYLNPIKTANFSSKFWYIQPGARYWWYEHFVGHFAAAHVAYGGYNLGNRKNDHKGWFTGVGASYGYTWILTKQWNFTLEGGLGIYYTKGTKYPKEFDQWKPYCITHYRRWMVAPSKFEASFTYLF